MMKLQILLVALGLVSAANPDFNAAGTTIDALLGKTLLNPGEVRRGVQFDNPLNDPYPELWYNVLINQDTDCFVEYPLLPDGSLDKTQYSLQSLTNETYEENLRDLDADRAETALFRTHRLHCGVCSNLQDLHVYLKYPDLTSPVKKCTTKLIDSNIIKCLNDLGFSPDCARIWFWNAKNTRKPHAKGGCLGTCIPRAFSANNSPKGNFNPCQPMSEKIKAKTMRGGKSNKGNTQTARGLNWLSFAGNKNSFALNPDKNIHGTGYCGNTINNKPACGEQQWRNGPFRLNACLQCDECRSGPVFQRVAGRTRRNSGIQSAIWRPDVYPLEHDYA